MLYPKRMSQNSKIKDFRITSNIQIKNSIKKAAIAIPLSSSPSKWTTSL